MRKLHIKLENGAEFAVDGIEVSKNIGLKVQLPGDGEELNFLVKADHADTYTETMAWYLEQGGTVVLSYKEPVSKEE